MYNIEYSIYWVRYVLLSYESYVAEFMGFEIHFIGCEMHFAIAILVAINKPFALEIKSELQPRNIQFNINVIQYKNVTSSVLPIEMLHVTYILKISATIRSTNGK